MQRRQGYVKGREETPLERKATPMNKPQQDPQSQAAKAALEALEQAFAYYTPEARTPSEAPVYEDIPLAA